MYLARCGHASIRAGSVMSLSSPNLNNNNDATRPPFLIFYNCAFFFLNDDMGKKYSSDLFCLFESALLNLS